MNYSTRDFESRYTYTGSDLGAVWSKEKTCFRVWAPTASAVSVNLYRSGDAKVNDLITSVPMISDRNGTWVAESIGDLNGVYYTYLVSVNGCQAEACDPYARTTGVNGNRAMVIDLRATDPDGWSEDSDPHAGISFTDAVIYELHVRDLSIDESSGIRNKGKYLGLIERGTTTPSGIPTGLDHIKALGITHLHILPMYDYGTVDEYHLDRPQFNWGYDPVNFNVPEGSYSTDPFNGAVRVAEVKQMVKGLHDNGISVIMDVVYNHVYDAGDFCFNRIVPNYFSRANKSGKPSNGSCCGNDTASERSMVRKYIVDSVKYWADEYHIDGFRFDLVGLIDTVTINNIMAEVHKTHPNVLFYGEGWDMDTDLTKRGVLLTTQSNAAAVPGFAFFSDTIRDLLKGSVFDNTTPGFISGHPTSLKELWKCYMGIPDWCPSPLQSINYVSCHDNNTLIDRIALSTPDASFSDRIRMNRLAAAFCITAQGIPFFQAGEEMLRSKPLADGYDHNSFRSSDAVNSLKWNLLERPEYSSTLDYYKGLIAFRKAHPALRMTSAEAVLDAIGPIASGNPHCIAFSIRGGKTDSDIFAIFNACTEAVSVPLPKGEWRLCINDNSAGTAVLETLEGTAKAAPVSAMILVKA